MSRHVFSVMVLLFVQAAEGQLNIVRNFRTSGTECSGISDPISFGSSPTTTGGGTLSPIFDAAADWWERTLPGLNQTVNIDYGWAARSGNKLASACTSSGNFTEGWIGFDNDGTSSFWADPSPLDSSEFSSSTLNEQMYAGHPVPVNTNRIYSGGPFSNWDLFTVALHEIGHVLGARGAPDLWGVDSMDGDIDVVIPGYNFAIPADGAHLDVDDAVLDSSLINGKRLTLSHVDILAIANSRGISNFDLYPSGGEVIASGSFHLPSIWSKGVHPDPSSYITLSSQVARTLLFGQNASAGAVEINGGGTLSLDFGPFGSSSHKLEIDVGIYVGQISAGNMNLSGGTVDAPTIRIGHLSGSTGSLWQTGGSMNAATSVIIGEQVNTSGTYILDGSIATITTPVVVAGLDGDGSILLRDGLASISQLLMLAQNSGSDGALEVSGGVLSTNSLQTGAGSAEVTLSDGEIQTVTTFIGFDGNATLNQTGGRLLGTTGVYVGERSGSIGTYNFFNGTIDAGTVRIGHLANSQGILEQFGGTVNTGNIASMVVAEQTGTNGVYSLYGGAIQSSASVLIGMQGNGTMSIEGGEANFDGTVLIARDAGSTGSLSLFGGILRGHRLEIGVGTSTIDMTGGRLEVTNVTFDFVQDGGTISPRDVFIDDMGNTTDDLSQAVAKVPLTFDGGLTVNDGALELELHTSTIGDLIQIAGALVLDSTEAELKVIANGVYSGPTTRGQTDLWTLIEGMSISGDFASETFNGLSMGHIDDGLFVITAKTSTEVSLSAYLALPGDANGDGTVDGQDFIVWNANKFTSGTDWTTGDFNGDGTTDGSDFLLWNSFKFTSADKPSRNGNSAVSVPEPMNGLIWISLACWLSFRSKSNRFGRLGALPAGPGFSTSV